MTKASQRDREAMAVFMHAMRKKNAFAVEDFKILNTNHFMDNSDYTTGYIFGFWGTK